MKAAFREWYPPTPDELTTLWENGVIVLDTNVMLGLYRYPPAVLDEFFRVLTHLREQLWMPHQVGLEFHRNREDRLPEQRTVLVRLLEEIDTFAGGLDRLAIPEYHPVLDRDHVEARRLAVRDSLTTLASDVQNALEETPTIEPGDEAASDPVLDRITELYGGAVGPPYSEEELAVVFSEARDRYSRQVPPGYKDAEKEEPRRYHDFIIWRQILDHAAASEEPRGCIFVTNDRKEDWWRRRRGILVGPRTELSGEYFDKTERRLQMYTPEAFLEHAKSFRLQDLSVSAIDAVRTASETSNVLLRLRQRRMVLPDSTTRVSALGRLHESLRGGGVKVVDDLNDAIRQLGSDFESADVRTPLFFSLINETYGPVRAQVDRGLPLRKREIERVVGSDTREEFVGEAHVAWLAQALFRLASDTFGEEELLTAFFGPDPPATAYGLVRRAAQAADEDQVFRGH